MRVGVAGHGLANFVDNRVETRPAAVEYYRRACAEPVIVRSGTVDANRRRAVCYAKTQHFITRIARRAGGLDDDPGMNRKDTAPGNCPGGIDLDHTVRRGRRIGREPGRITARHIPRDRSRSAKHAAAHQNRQDEQCEERQPEALVAGCARRHRHESADADFCPPILCARIPMAHHHDTRSGGSRRDGSALPAGAPLQSRRQLVPRATVDQTARGAPP